MMPRTIGIISAAFAPVYGWFTEGFDTHFRGVPLLPKIGVKKSVD